MTLYTGRCSSIIAQVRISALTDMHAPFREPGQYRKPSRERLDTWFDDHLRVCGQRIGVYGSDKYRIRCGLRVGNSRKRPSAQRRPAAALQQLVNHYLPIQATDLVSSEALKLTFFTVGDFNDHTFECALGATVDVDHLTSDRCRKVHPGGFLITEENLSFRYKIPLFHLHRRLHAGVVRP